MHRSVKGHDWYVREIRTELTAGRWECSRCQARVMSTSWPERSRKVRTEVGGQLMDCDEVIAWRVMSG